MVENDKKKEELKKLPVQLFIVLAIAIFIIEYGVMMLLHNVFPPMPVFINSLVDSALLLIGMFPILYIFVFRPLLLEIVKHSQTQEIVKDQNVFLNNTINSLPHPFYVIDPDNYKILLSNSAADFNELDENTTCYSHTHKRNKPCDGTEHPCPIEIAKKSKEPTVVEHTHYDKDGHPRVFEIHCYPIFDKEGHIAQFIEYSLDITERKQAEAKIKETKDYLSNVIDSSLDPIVISNIKGYIEIVNQAFLELVDCKKEEVMVRHIADFSPTEEGEYESTAGELVKINEKHLKEIREKPTILYEEGRISGWETFFIRKNKKIVPVEANIVFLHNDAGEKIGAVGIIRDNTERRKSEKELKKSEEKYHSVIEKANDAIISVNEAGMIVDFNKKAEEMFGYSCDDITGKSILLLTPPSKKGEQKEFLKMINGEQSISSKIIEREGLRKGGKEFPVEISTFRIKLHGECLYTSIIRDITKRKEMEYKLLQSEKLKSLGELAGGVAHNFNNTLAAILGRAQLLKMDLERPPIKQEGGKSKVKLSEGLEAIENAARDGAETVKRLQEYVKGRSNEKRSVCVDINEIICDSLELTKIRWKDDAESKGKTIEIRKELLPPSSIEGCVSELREVFINLINNAIDAIAEEGLITIKTSEEAGHVCVTLEDTGSGIPKRIINRIFDPFFTTKGPQYSGLGLSASFGIIKSHQGSMGVNSVEGQRTTFTIKLPISEKAIKETKTETIPKEQRKAKILVIDDEESVRKLLSDIIKSGGHEVEIAPDGIKGVELFKEKEFDLIFTDLGMPGMSGWQVSEKIKSINGRVPVALITGWDVELKESELRKNWIDLVIHKPFEVNQVLQLVQEGMVLRDRFKAA